MCDRMKSHLYVLKWLSLPMFMGVPRGQGVFGRIASLSLFGDATSLHDDFTACCSASLTSNVQAESAKKIDNSAGDTDDPR